MTKTILNWRRWDDHISLSGQPTEDEMAAIHADGVRHIVNLGPHSNTGALRDEAGTVAALGMSYTYIPVDFDNPTDADFDAFCAAMAETKGARVHVHCIYNARVSAFFYRYATSGYGGTVADAFALMDSIWRPGGVWAAFVGNASRSGAAHEYEGHDYHLTAT